MTIFIDDGVVVGILSDSCEACVCKRGAVIGWLLVIKLFSWLSWLATLTYLPEVSESGCATPRMGAIGRRGSGRVEKGGKGPLVG